MIDAQRLKDIRDLMMKRASDAEKLIQPERSFLDETSRTIELLGYIGQLQAENERFIRAFKFFKISRDDLNDFDDIEAEDKKQCVRCIEWSKQGLSETCPSCEFEGEKNG